MRKRSSISGLLGLVATWALLLTIFSLWKGVDFVGRGSLETMARQTAIVGFGAIGMTFVIVAGMIDLSAGSVIAFVTVMIAWVLKGGHSPLFALLVGVLAGAAAGSWNGQLITRLKISPFIVTLGSLLVVRGVAKGVAHDQKIDAPMTWLADILSRLKPDEQWKLLPEGVWLLLVAAVIASFILERTVFGRNVTATGANEEAARLAGIDPQRTRRLVFLLAGAMLGLAGLMQFSRLTVGDPTVAQGLELDIIAATVIGGASLSGGQGTISGSLIGALIMTTIRSGCTQVGLPNWVQEIVTGLIIVIALALDRWRQSRHAAAS